MSPEELDEQVFGSVLDARYADVAATVDVLADIADQRIASGHTPAVVAASMEAALLRSPDNVDGRATIALAHAAVRLAELRKASPAPPSPAPRPIRQWVVTDPLGGQHIFEDELLAARAALAAPYNPDQVVHLTTPDGARYLVIREWR